uniref:Retrovirus-related Pol polyprotein from transposon opus n=1 Tax=Cajanus cajan TaxID=3821 RepID=A0A151UDK4_CAJCA
MSAFAWHVKDMPGVDPDFMCHKLAIDPRAKPVIQKRRKCGDDKRKAIAEETDKLLMTGFIREIQYPTWLANVVMVRKRSGKWRMCTDFTDLNKACPKDSYPLPNIDCLVDGATYQRLMDKVLVDQLGRNVEAYVDDMVVKSMSLDRHLDDLKELFETIGKYQLKLNPEKCSFGVQAGKFLGFLLTHRGIKANPEKCSAIINMRSPSTVKEVQQLTRRMASLSRFLYQKIEKLALAILVTARKLRHYFQSYEVIVRTDHPIRQVLQKPDLAGRMMKWSIELSEYSIKYEPRGAIKAQALADFVMELTAPADEGLKKRVQDSGASWVEELPRVLWSYHTTVHSSTRDTPFNLVYGTDAMIPIEIAEPSIRTTTFSEEESDQGRRVDLDLIAETRERARINQVAAHKRAAFKYNTKVVPRDFVVGDLVLKRAQLTQMRNK